MNLQIFTVYDSKIEAYLVPFYFKNRGECLRTFTDTVNDPSHMFNRHPGDYTLFHIGQYNEDDASFSLLDHHVNLGKAIEFIKEDSNGATVSDVAFVQSGTKS